MLYYRCIVCDFIYEPDQDKNNLVKMKYIPFSELPESWKCPECGSGKNFFKPDIRKKNTNILKEETR